MMIRHGFVGILAGGLMCLAGPVLSEPVTDRAASAVADDSTEVWGDPEDAETADRGWTWFGMGYEHRTRAATSTSAGERPDQARTSGGGGRGAGR